MQRSCRVFPPSGPWSWFCFVVAVVVAVSAQLHPVKVLAGWEEEQGSRHTWRGVVMGWRTRGLKGTGGRQAGVTHAVRGKGKEGSREKKKLSLILPQSPPLKKIHLNLLRQNQKGRQKSPRCKIYIYTPGRYIYV